MFLSYKNVPRYVGAIIFYCLFGLIINTSASYEQLPNCKETSDGLVLVSTLDGKLSALNANANLLWQVETGPGPLLTSNIHNLELTNNGQWIRIIPSLSGSLYKFDGSTIDQIPITADTLLKSSFKYSDDLVIAGGLEVRTYGVGFRRGTIYYTCSLLKCINNTNDEFEPDDILIVERSTQTVRAIEPQTGSERWNFSVGVSNVKLHDVTCRSRAPGFVADITAVMPEGLLKISDGFEHKFTSPIVSVWKWDGFSLSEVDVFAGGTGSGSGSDSGAVVSLLPSLYLGMHNKQLYIRESSQLINIVDNKRMKELAMAESKSLLKIPWKPVPASDVQIYEDSTALSVLYASEYINGNGYYLYTDKIIPDKEGSICEHSSSNNNDNTTRHVINNPRTIDFIILLGRETMLVFCLTIILIFILSTLQGHKEKIIVQHVQIPPEKYYVQPIERNDFCSRYLNDFDTVRCLGKGGFGVVFEVKQKMDECSYAIKRIRLPNGEKSRNRVLREVKALAKLDHQNIVRYFNSWVEKPPFGWQEEHDKRLLQFQDDATCDNGSEIISTLNEYSTRRSRSVCLNIEPCHDSLPDLHDDDDDDDDSLEIVFENEDENIETEGDGTKLDQNDNSRSTDVSNLTEHQRKKINWKRPDRCHHSWDFSQTSKNLSPSKNPSAYLYIQMQLCQKNSLKEWLKMNATRNHAQILDIFKQILLAVEYVHLRGLIHRDLKPSNIFFSLEGQIKVGDFGLVKGIEDSIDFVPEGATFFPSHTNNVGTYLYMSPEQLRGDKYDHKVDIYSLGLIFFELLVPFSTEMERIKLLGNLKKNSYPDGFREEHRDEYELLRAMLCEEPEKRPTTIGIRAKAPVNCPDGTFGSDYHFKIPVSVKQ